MTTQVFIGHPHPLPLAFGGITFDEFVRMLAEAQRDAPFYVAVQMWAAFTAGSTVIN